MTGVREAQQGDLPTLAAIYDREIRDGVATFETEPAGTAPFAAKLAAPDPLLVVTDEIDRPLGYAYATLFRARAAYAATRETSIYLAPEAQGRGLGRLLYDDLLARLDAAGIHRVIAGVALPNPGSVALHHACGFHEVGTFTEVGRKFDRWIDVAFYERTRR